MLFAHRGLIRLLISLRKTHCSEAVATIYTTMVRDVAEVEVEAEAEAEAGLLRINILMGDEGRRLRQ